LSDKQTLIDKVVKQLDKKFEAKIKTLEDKKDANSGVAGFVATNNLAVDFVIGRRGLPIGRIVEVSGQSGSGKSSYIASMIGAAQARGITCALIDAENSYDPSWARRFNVDTDSLILIEPSTLEESFDMTRGVIKAFREESQTEPIFVAYDSVSAIPTNAELEQEDSSASSAQAEHARIISRELRKIGGLVKDQNVCLTFVSQLKVNPRSTPWADNESIIGGSAIKFHAGLRLRLAKIKTLKDKDKPPHGITIQVTALKNKFTSPYKVSTFDLYFEEGFKPKEILLDFMVETDMIKEKAGWYEWEGQKLRKTDLAPLLDESHFEAVYEKLGIPK
jgi:recombination protein RecA